MDWRSPLTVTAVYAVMCAGVGGFLCWIATQVLA